MPAHCETLAAIKDLDEMYEHMNSFCMQCIEAQLSEAANGEELIFTESQPSWIEAQQAREAEVEAERARDAVAAKKRAAIEKARERNGEEKKISWNSEEEVKMKELRRMAKEISDKQLEFEIRKMLKLDKLEAAQMRLELKREVAEERKEKEKEKEKVEVKQQIKEQKVEAKKNPDAPKELNKFQKRPWQPDLQRALAISDERRSALSVQEQKRYVSILSNFHAAEKATRFEQNTQDLKMYDAKLEPERQIVETMVKARLEGENVSIKELHKEVDAVLGRWMTRYHLDQKRYEKLKEIEWRRETETPAAPGVLRPQFERMLMAAPNPKLVLPDTHDRLHVSYEPNRFDARTKRRENIVDDKALLPLCFDSGCTIAMDATTAVHLMARPAEPRGYMYNVPVTVFDQFHGGMIVRLCILGKPRPQGGVSARTLLQMVAKYRVKSTFTRPPEDAHPAKPSASKDTVSSSSSSSSAPSSSKDTVATTSTEEETGGKSLLDSLLGSMASSLPSTAAMASAEGAAPPAKPSTTSHSYGLFRIPSYSQAETKVLIRSSPCARNAATGGTEYALAAKVEMAAEAGVMKETYEEMLWTSMKTTFKGAVNSATIHMHPYMKDGLQITQSRAIPQANQHNEGFHPLVSTRTEHLSRLLGELQQLEPGEYSLQVSPVRDDMILLKESKSGSVMYTTAGPRRASAAGIKASDNFTRIDDKRVLHWQIMQGRAPLSLWPADHHILTTYAKREETAGEKKQGWKKPHPHHKQHHHHQQQQWKPQHQMSGDEKQPSNFSPGMNRNARRRWAKRKSGAGGGQAGQDGQPPTKKPAME